jgi:hypothetical protein
MKKVILSSAIALIALLSANTVNAQNPKISNPDKATVDISCSYNDDGSYTVAIKYLRLTGLGNATSATATLTVTATADVNCYNKGQLKQDVVKSIPGQSSTASGKEVFLTPKNGVLIIQNCIVSASIVGNCKNTNDKNGFESEVTNVDVSDLFITINGSKVSLKDYISQLDNCLGICN